MSKIYLDLNEWVNHKLNVKIRLAEQKDADSIRAIDNKIASTGYDWFRGRQSSLEYEINKSHYIAAQHNRKVIGYGAIREWHDNSTYLFRAAVDPDHSRLGIGHVLAILRILGTLHTSLSWIDVVNTEGQLRHSKRLARAQ